MISFKEIIEDIKFFIKKNNVKAITGNVLQQRLLDMVGKTEEVYAEDRERLNTNEADIAELQGGLSELDTRVTQNSGDISNNSDRIDGIDSEIVTIKEKDAEQDSNIQVNADNILNIDANIDSIKAKDVEQDEKLADHEQRIQDNASNISYLEGEIGRVDKKDAEQDGRIKSNEDGIKDLYATTQIADLDVEIRNVGGGRYVSSDSANDIYNYAIKGGNVKIQINDKKYEFVTYRNRTAYFRYLVVLPDRVSEEDIEIYETDATFKTIEYEAVFDATPLLTSFTSQQPLGDTFIADLDKAISEKKLIYVTGNGSIYLLTGTSKSGDKRTFTGIGRNTIYVLSYGSSKIVSLDTHTIGVDIHIFNNENSVNILNLTTDSTNEEIKEVFTDSNGDIIIPHANDIFYIYQNSDVANNGSVESMVEDSYEIRLAVNMSNFENNLIHRVFYTLSYDANVGVNSLRITSKIDNVINPSKITEDAMDKMSADIVKSVKVTPQELTEEEQKQVQKNIGTSTELAFRQLWIDICGTDGGWTEEKGYFLHEIPLTYEDASAIYSVGDRPITRFSAFNGCEIKTNLRPKYVGASPYFDTVPNCMDTFRGCYKLVYAALSTNPDYSLRPSNVTTMFRGNEALRKIDRLDFSKITSAPSTFLLCYELRDCEIINLHCDVEFRESSKLSYDSINYMVTNRADSNQITITLHAIPFALLNGTATDEQYQTSGHTKQEWTTLNSMAVVSKNIIFATA